MSKKFKVFFCLIFTLAIALAVFGGVNVVDHQYSKPVAIAETTNVSSQAQDEEEKQLTIFDYISITQSEYVFKESDFSHQITVGNLSYPALYTDQTITISLNYTLGIYDDFRLFIDGSESSVPEHTQIIGSKTYYIFDINTLTEDTRTRIGIRVSIYNPPAGKIPASYDTYELDFQLIQTKVNFHESSEESKFEWEYTTNGVIQNINAPINGSNYNPISLIKMPSGTDLNPVFVKFSYCGESYEVYNIGGNLYNKLDNTKLSSNALNFNISGTYIVEIYDNTIYEGYSNKNYLHYEFSVTQNDTRLSPFYIYAHLEDNTLVMNQQISNARTFVELVNINLLKVYNNVDRILVTRTYKPSGGENIAETTEYKNDFLNDLPSTLTFDDDGTYNIQVIGINNDNIIKEFTFVMLQGIRTYFEIDGVMYEMDADEPSNTTKTFSVNRSVASSYNDIKGVSEYTFNVIVARSAPAISGVNNNSRDSNNVAITIYGVGDIEVSITQDGKTTTKTVQNGTKLDTFTETGDYFIKITDQMGTTVTKSFTITIKLNTASIILIVIGALLIVGMIVFIFITRAKVKVK